MCTENWYSHKGLHENRYPQSFADGAVLETVWRTKGLGMVPTQREVLRRQLASAARMEAFSVAFAFL